MNKIPNRQAICETLMEAARNDKNIVVLCSDSRGSASLTHFANAYPQQFVEVGIAEQNLVSIAAGLAKCGKKVFAASPACFLSTRSYEQCKVDVAYSNASVTLIGISGGISYGALGMSHHSAQDIAAMAAIPNMRVYLPSDRFQTSKLIEALLKDDKPAYIRVGRNPVEDIYSNAEIISVKEAYSDVESNDKDNSHLDIENVFPEKEKKSYPLEKRIDVMFEMDKATLLSQGEDVTLIACGEMVKQALEAANLLAMKGIQVTVLDMYCLKPLDEEAIVAAAKKTKLVVTVEEHSPFGGLGAMVSQVVSRHCPKKVVNIALPDEPVITGTSQEVFAYYGMNGEGIAEMVVTLLKNEGVR